MFGRAAEDLRRAGLLLIGKPLIADLGSWAGDSAGGDPDSAVLSTLQHTVPLRLGQTLYLRGEYVPASHVLAESAKAALTPDQLARSLLWLFFATRRSGAVEEAGDVLELARPAWADSSSAPELRLLLGYRGILSTEEIRRLALDPREPQEHRALLAYGIGFFLLLRPERGPDAELWLERAREGGNWAGLAYLAAEADLARFTGRRRIIR
jgi:hypothetical protein